LGVSLEYALVTSSSLPSKVKESSSYVAVDKSQWLDLVDYSQEIVTQDPDQRVLFLIVAKGTAEQEAADTARQQAVQAEHTSLEAQREAAAAEKAAKERSTSEQKKAKANLRAKSKSIFNALYKH
jgi:hypothetical protein